MAHPTFSLYGYERFFAMNSGASSKLAHVVTVRGDIPSFLHRLPQAVLQTFNRHPKMRASILPGSAPQKAMICSPLADVLELNSLVTIQDCRVDEEKRAELFSAIMDHSTASTLPQLNWVEFVQNECEKPLDREKAFPFYFVVQVDSSSNAFARLFLFSDHYMSDATSGFVILRDILQTINTSEEMPNELALRESLYEGTHYVNAWMNVVHEAVSKYVIQPLLNFDTNAFVPLLPLQTKSQRDFAGSPPTPSNPSFALCAQGSDENMQRAMARCKEEHVSLQGAIVAASLMAFGLTKYDGKLGDCHDSLRLRLDVMNDMRQQVALNPVKRGRFDALLPQSTELEREVPVGLYSAPAHLVYTSSEGIDVHGMSFWDVARKADHEWECAVVGHELKMQSIYVNEVLNAESGTNSGLCVANCALSDVTVQYLDCSDQVTWPFPSKLITENESLIVEDLHVYSSQSSLSSTSNLYITALSHFNYALMYKLEPEVAHKLFKWMVQCTERIGEFREQDTFAQAADKLASGGVEVGLDDDTVEAASATHADVVKL